MFHPPKGQCNPKMARNRRKRGHWSTAEPRSHGPAEVAFGPSGLKLSAGDLAYLDRVEAMRRRRLPVLEGKS